ncbi:MAG TPA: hypothetical protein VLE95_08320 [Chlamydiales bacterium]|nr:hypothetical protein [Chlamydiales bacterium]
MRGLETGKDKIQKICDALRRETLEPAKQEAREIVETAHLEAKHLLEQAKEKSAAMIAKTERELEEKKKLFESSLTMACRQGIETLKQKIETELFNHELVQLVEKETSDPKTIANILNSFMKIMEEKGIDDDFVALIPKSITPRSINALLLSHVLERIKKEGIKAGDFMGGVQIQLKNRKISIDISDTAIREMIAQYIRRDFRDLVFSA